MFYWGVFAGFLVVFGRGVRTVVRALGIWRVTMSESKSIIRKRKGKGERITLPVSTETKTKWEEVGKALEEKGFEIDTDRAVKRIIRSLEAIVNPGPPRRNGEVLEVDK